MRANELSQDHPPEMPAGTADDDIELVEMANLSTADTGVDGVIDISTAQGPHGPREKWYPGRPSKNGPCLSASIADIPVRRNLNLPDKVAQEAADTPKQWVAINHDALLSFWNDGHAWMSDEVHAFIKSLQKV